VRLLPIVLLAMVTLASCAGTGNVSNIDDKYSQISVGQNKAEIFELLGEPGNRAIRFDTEALQYCGTGFFSDQYLTIWLKSDSVVGLNKHSGAEAVGFCSMAYPAIDWESAPDITNR
jgi:hypothetical protein